MRAKLEIKTLSHLDRSGRARMVDVSGKEISARRAVAESHVRMSRATASLVSSGALPKGNALETARLAGVMATKRTSELIPLCHPLSLTHADVEAQPYSKGVRFLCSVTCNGQTGVEMEALTGAAVAALTLYDMIKAVERGAVIEQVRLLEKSGGKSGYIRAAKRPSQGKKRAGAVSGRTPNQRKG